jgi:probable HAF family extracellular repeat protein
MKKSELTWLSGHFVMPAVIGLGLLLSAGAIAPPDGGVPHFLVSSFEGMGGLTDPYEQYVAWDVSLDGKTVVGNKGDRAFVWNEIGGLELLPVVTLPYMASGCNGISADGTIAAGSVLDDMAGQPACRWTKENGAWSLEVLGDLAGGTSGSHAYAMTPDGQVLAGFVNSASGTEAARWTRSPEGTWAIQYLGDFAGGDFGSEAYGCSSDGSVIVGRGSIKDGARAFRWTEGTGLVDLGVVGKRKFAAAWGCSADGSVVVGEVFTTRGRDEVAFRWTLGQGMVSLGVLPGGKTSEADAVSADGSIIVGGSSTKRDGVRAFIWDATSGMRCLEDVLAAHGAAPPSGWKLLYANGVATPEAGVVVVVGKAFNPQGDTEAWRAVIVGY